MGSGLFPPFVMMPSVSGIITESSDNIIDEINNQLIVE